MEFASFVPGPSAGMMLAQLGAEVVRADLLAGGGSPTVDHTVNAGGRHPRLTGPEAMEAPVDHVPPAWDQLSGATAAVGHMGW